MNKLLELKDQYLSNQIIKPDYLDEMNALHRTLFDYSELISNSIAKKIEITENGVIIELKDTNIKLYSIKDDKGIIPMVILNFGEYEERLWNKALTLLNNPRTVIDIGGNIGYFSLYFANKLPNAKFHCFEPIPNTYTYLEKNLQINNSKNIAAYNIGFTNKKQAIEMFYNPEGSGGSSMRDLLGASCTKKITCEFATLDDFVRENNIDNIDFIKCDVEGAEKFVFEGAINTIKKHKPIIFSEMLRKWSAKFDYHPNDIIKFFDNIDYKCFAISADSIEEIKEVTEETVNTNFIFIDKNSKI